MKTKLLRIPLLIAGLLIAWTAVDAQTLTDYTVNKYYDQPYEDISGNEIWGPGDYFYGYYNSTLYEWNTGNFNFKYDDRYYYRFRVYGGGRIVLMNPGYCYDYSSIYPRYYNAGRYNMTYSRPTLYPFYAYYNTYYSYSAPGKDKGVYWEVRGTAPNRTMIVEWQNLNPYPSYNAAYVNFQCWMYESSGIIQYKYGDMYYPSSHYAYYSSGSYYYGYNFHYVGATACDRLTAPDGYTDYEYINIYGKENGEEIVPHYSNDNYLPMYDAAAADRKPYDYEFNSNQETDWTLITEEYWSIWKRGLVVEFTSYPVLANTYPPNGAILERGKVYSEDNATDQHPACIFNRYEASSPEVHAWYKVSGPMPTSNPSYTTIYTSGTPEDNIVYFDPQPLGIGIKSNLYEAYGIAAGDNGELDLEANATSIRGGQYQIEAEMVIYNDDGDEIFRSAGPKNLFVIALEDDISLKSVLAPKSRDDRKYPIGTGVVPIQVEVGNVGLSTVSRFTVYAKIYDENDNVVYNDDKTWIAYPNPIYTGGSVTMSLDYFNPTAVGDYRLELEVDLERIRDENGDDVVALDDDDYNDHFPRPDRDDYFFNVAYEWEAEAVEILSPIGDENVMKRPMQIMALFLNNGVSDMSDVPVRAWITDPNGQIIGPFEGAIPDIGAAPFNEAGYAFPEEFIPTVPGVYSIKIEVRHPDDPVTENDVIEGEFEVIPSMEGTFTIGKQNLGDSYNFETIQDAVDRLYKEGVTGPVTFELTDSYYKVGNPELNQFDPALDLRSTIIGVDEDNPIIFKPSREMRVKKGGVRIHLRSANGIGIWFGQEVMPSNGNAVVGEFPENSPYRRQFAPGPEYVTFDGGEYQAFKFELEVVPTDPDAADFRAPIYLGDGASNITVTNSIITNYSEAQKSYKLDLPKTRYNQARGRFEYQNNFRDNGETYSAGIVLRSTPPINERTEINSDKLDTLTNNSNVITNNTIHGFGYGIASMGMGPLYVAPPTSKYMRYYNNNNIYEGNKIYDVSRAGIFLGYEEKSNVKNNVIYDVNGNLNTDAAGIIIGGEFEEEYYGYNNVQIEVDGNEISNVRSKVFATGIEIEQTEHSFQDAEEPDGMYEFPDVSEAMKVYNNSIWDISGSGNAGRAGIRMFTQREPGTDIYTPSFPRYFTRGDMIVNNTIWLNGSDNDATVAAISVQQAKFAKIYNNAIAVTTNPIDDNVDVAAAIFYQGLVPEDPMGLDADRNAFWLDNSNVSMYRFIETDERSNILEMGTRHEFTTLEQWQMWTGEDMNSVIGDFTQDLHYIGNNPKMLRVDTQPEPPLGSILNNRGERFDFFQYDIDNDTRGYAGELYDIGAFEFDGRMFLDDMEIVGIDNPGAYRDGQGMFRDAEYIMTEAPIDVDTRIRNNGNMPKEGVELSVMIYRETPTNSGYWDRDPVFDDEPVATGTLLVGAMSSETKVVTIQPKNDQGELFVPQAFVDLKGHDPAYDMPEHFSSMEANVTPRYRIDVKMKTDQYNDNNRSSKVVRFYLLRSNLRLLISTENSSTMLDENSTTNEIAGKLNYTALVDAFEDLGWIIDLGTENPRFDIDIFDRMGWEPKSVNYEMYRTMFWSDGHDFDANGNEKPLTRYEIFDLKDYLAAGDPVVKKNLVIGSQEMVRQNYDKAGDVDSEILSASFVEPGYYDATQAIGISVSRDFVQNIAPTGYDYDKDGVSEDADPNPGLINVDNTVEGQTSIAFVYNDNSSDPEVVIPYNDRIMGTATRTLTDNKLYFAVDWRHFDDVEDMIRSIVDYFHANGGIVIPVDILDFQAYQSGSEVELVWSTASEENSARFEVEKAQVTNDNIGDFAKFDEVEAAGNSSIIKNYGPVIDNKVSAGNTYAYRLKMVDRDGDWDYSPVKTVTLTGANGILTVGEVAPSPVYDDATIHYNLSAEMDLTIELFDVTGKSVAQLFNGHRSAGSYELTIDAQNYNSGIYTVVIRTGDLVVTRKVNIVK